jgi:prepilin-type N-terminal cleavage/methylation domain-containing protein
MQKDQTDLARKKGWGKRGFSLTELAIVLGVMGLILGALWAAASSVYSNNRASKAESEVLTVAQAIRAMYATYSSVDVNADMPAGFGASTVGHANATYLAAGVFPSDMLNAAPAAATAAQDPWAGGVAVVSTEVAVANDSFAVEFDKVSQDSCIKILMSIAGAGYNSSVYGVSTGAAGTLPIAGGGTNTAGTTALPISIITAQGLCTNIPSAIAFQFKLKG